MDRKTFFILSDHLKRHENLHDTRLVTFEKAVTMFLLIVGYNVRMWVVANYFQHFIETIVWHLKEVKQTLYWLGKILICPSNMGNKVSLYVVNNPKYFPWFKVRFYKTYL